MDVEDTASATRGNTTTFSWHTVLLGIRDSRTTCLVSWSQTVMLILPTCKAWKAQLCEGSIRDQGPGSTKIQVARGRRFRNRW